MESDLYQDRVAMLIIQLIGLREFRLSSDTSQVSTLHYAKITVVHLSVMGGYQNSRSFLNCKATPGLNIMASTNTIESASHEWRNKIRLQSSLTCSSPVTAKELDSGVDVVHECFTEGGDSILNIISSERLQAKLQHKQRVSWVAN